LTTLHLPISRKWFDLIAVGEKRVEYRACSPHWQSRIDGKEPTHVRLVNGYGAGRPWMLVEILGITTVYRSPGPGDAGPVGMVYAIELGEIIEHGNLDIMALKLFAIARNYILPESLVSDVIMPRDLDGTYTFEGPRG